MTSRLPLTCTECETVILTRTQIGHSDYQEFAFACPKCAIEIRFGMAIDQKNLSFAYPLIRNARIAANEEGVKFELRFDSENLRSLLPSPTPAGFRLMPFMETVFLAKDPEKNQKSFGQRHAAMRNGWPVIEKMLVHEANGNLKLFNQSMRQLGGKNSARSPLEMTVNLIRVLEVFGTEFLLDKSVARNRIHSLIRKASTNRTALEAALAHWKSEGRLDEFWRQLKAIRKGWSQVYYIVAPIYWSFGWDPTKAVLDDYTLCQKRFDDLRTFYVDCFETFCRLSTVAAGFEGVAELGQFVVPFPNAPRPITELEAMANGNKHTLLAPLQVGDIFVPFIDAKLRNGVGHNSAHYDVMIDTIGYRNHSPSRGIEDFSISYVRFCEKLVRLYAQLESCAPLVHFMRVREAQSSNAP